MSYTINKTDGNVLVTLLDGTTNTDTGLTLIGRNAVNYGDAQNENFVRLLENFADNIPPGQSVGFSPMSGTLWWDTTNQRLRVYNGNNWLSVSERTVSSTAPTTVKTGDQWYNTTTQQLNSYTGSGWQVVGPGFTAAQGKSGSFVETITASDNQAHTVVNTYTNGNLISISGADSTFTPLATYVDFPVIQPGLNFSSNVVINGTAQNAVTVGGVYGNAFARTDSAVTFASDVNVTGNLVLSGANIRHSAATLSIQNTTFRSNIEFYVNSLSGNVRPLLIDGASGAVIVGTPLTSFSVANKGYVDAVAASLNYKGDLTNASIVSNISQLNQSTSSALLANVVLLNANLASVVASTNSNVNTLANYTVSSFGTIYNNEVSIQLQLSAIENAIANLAAVSDPSLVGNVLINGNAASNIAYVNSSVTAINNNLNTIINGLATSAQANLVNTTSTLANVASPAFTGTPTAPTPASGDNSTKIATTAFVNTTVASNKFNYTVSASPPSGGNNGDFWFQTG